MNRLDKLFAHKKNNVLNIYCTAGYPQLNSTVQVIEALQNNGVDIVEIGMPYSDPLADGEVIQASSNIALNNGMTIEILFTQLQNVRKKNLHSAIVKNDLCIILMGYLNPVLQLGIEKFCSRASELGVDGIIIPDLPLHEFETLYQPLFEKNNLKFIFLITPETSEERIKKIDSLCSGFIYAVSSSSTTGNNKPIESQEEYFKKLKNMHLKNPVLVGFGIKDKASFTTACKYTQGAIIGSAYINALKNANDINAATEKFISSLR